MYLRLSANGDFAFHGFNKASLWPDIFSQLLLLRSIFYDSAGKESNAKVIKKSGLKTWQIGHILYKNIYNDINVYLSNVTFFYHDEQIIALKYCFLGNLHKFITRGLRAKGLKSWKCWPKILTGSCFHDLFVQQRQDAKLKKDWSHVKSCLFVIARLV